jgi:hypothetical protein
MSDGFLVTLSLSNELTDEGLTRTPWIEACLFQVSLECRPEKGRIRPYPRTDIVLPDSEEIELEIRHRHHGIYGIGHGGAVDWDIDEEGEVTGLRSDFMPTFAVPKITQSIESLSQSRTLELGFLSTIEITPITVCEDLDRFVDEYERWIEGRQRERETLGFRNREAEVSGVIIDRMRLASDRMRSGVERLRSDRLTATAFSIANQAMRHVLPQKKAAPVSWRPFQLGFFLLALESVIDEQSEHRDQMDLLWFPTGGGKTEAYQALIAFLIAYRRMRHPGSGGGTAVIMRYTLRLLTIQQFERAATLISRLELIRRTRTKELGQTPITLGLWVGRAASPNNFKQAAEAVQQGQLGKLVLKKCPICDAPIRTPVGGDSEPKSIEWSRDHFRFLCPNPDCQLHGEIPVNIVDDHLYRHPPTLLLGTVDKFAMLAWKSEPSALLGGAECRPPELIVQDELHLISGELGTLYGLYEAAFDTVLGLRGVRPKYLASTATIRKARRQVQMLYGREVTIFPPPGLSADDSFFAQTLPISEENPGRLYLGYLAPNRRQQEALAPLVAALLVCSTSRSDDSERRDAWWTLVVYHGSLRGVGNSTNTMQNLVPGEMAFLLDEEAERGQADELEERPRRRRTLPGDQVVQLTSNRDSSDIPNVLSSLEWPCDQHPPPPSVLLCTNMLSVGVDVDRLALMIVNGQPLTTAEYIQASSRVGRAAVPGVVVAHYFRGQARSLSHYENFRPYHESFNRFVEPTSVTPFSAPARQRALHAALVITLRHGVPVMLGQNAAETMDPRSESVRHAVEALARRCAQADPGAAHRVRVHLDELLRDWSERIGRCREERRKLTYSSRDLSHATLLVSPDSKTPGDAWPTMLSMRHVDDECGLKQVRPRGSGR